VSLDDLIESIRSGNEIRARCLISQEVVNATDSDGVPLLQIAVQSNAYFVANWLVDEGADIDAQGPSGRTVLHALIQDIAHAKKWMKFELFEMANALLEKVLEKCPDLSGKKGHWNALEEAAHEGLEDVVERLIACGADVNDLDCQVGPLYAAVRGKHPAVVAVLLEHGADANRPDGVGQTPIIHATAQGEWVIVEHLLKKGSADPNVASQDGTTALMFAAASGSEALTNLLVENGAETSQKDANGKTALDHAREFGSDHVIPILEESKRLKPGGQS